MCHEEHEGCETARLAMNVSDEFDTRIRSNARWRVSLCLNRPHKRGVGLRDVGYPNKLSLLGGSYQTQLSSKAMNQFRP